MYLHRFSSSTGQMSAAVRFKQLEDRVDSRLTESLLRRITLDRLRLLRWTQSADLEKAEATHRKFQANFKDKKLPLPVVVHGCVEDAFGGRIEWVHLVSVVGGKSWTYIEGYVAMIHSVLITAELKYAGACFGLHFYVITETRLVPGLTRLWEFLLKETPLGGFPAPWVRFEVIPADAVLEELAALPVVNGHYSGALGLLKLRVPDMLPDYVRHVIILDTDIIVTSPIMELFSYFTQFKTNHALALVEEQSGFYTSTDPVNDDPESTYRWPHVGKGFNTGVILIDRYRLVCQRALLPEEATDCVPWRTRWQDALFRTLEAHPTWELQLGDQDVLNNAVVDAPELVLTLPCQWNMQDSGLKRELFHCQPLMNIPTSVAVPDPTLTRDDDGEAEAGHGEGEFHGLFHFNYLAKERDFFEGFRAAYANFLIPAKVLAELVGEE